MKFSQLLDKPTATVEELAKKYNTSVEAVQAQLDQGMKVEQEHTSHESVARQIALDHLGEDLFYYEKLQDMEQPVGETIHLNQDLKTAKDLTEIFQEPAQNVAWKHVQHGDYKFFETEFPFMNKRVVVGLHEDHDQTSAKYVSRNRDLDMPSDYQGYVVVFSVNGTTDVTGEIGSAASRLFVKVVSLLRGFLTTHDWDYIIFTGEDGSRDKLYDAMARQLSPQVGAQLATYRSDFLIYKPYPLTEVFDTSAAKEVEWDHRGDSWFVEIPFDNHEIKIEISKLTSTQQPGRGLWVEFAVDGWMSATGKLGNRGNQVFGIVFNAVKEFINDYPAWDWILFTGDDSEPSRNKLYAAWIKKIAAEHPHLKAQQTGHRFWLVKQSQLQEVFNQPEIQVKWKSLSDGWETEFKFGTHNVELHILLDHRGFTAQHVFDKHHVKLPTNNPGYEISFWVNDWMHKTGAMGTQSVQLFAKVIGVVQGFLNTHPWSYVVFTGSEGSRNKLYAAMSHKLAQENHAQAITSGNDFVIYKSSQIDESFDYKLEKDDWEVVYKKLDEINIEFKVGDEPYDLEIQEIRKSPGIFEVIFSHVGVPADTGTQILGTGQAQKVFAAVAQLIEYAVQQLRVRALYFTASEPSRIKLYKALTKHFASKLGWKVSTDPQFMPYQSQGAPFLVYKPGFSITEHVHLQEVFDYKLDKQDWQVVERYHNYCKYVFRVEGEPYEMEVMQMRDRPQVWDVVFGHMREDNPIGITHTGSASKVFSAVAQLLSMAINYHNMKGIYFTAREPSRKKLYDALAKSFAQKMGWQLITDPSLMPQQPGLKEKAYLIQASDIQECAGVGLVVPGVNMPAGMHKDEIRRQAAKFGNSVSANGVPPIADTSGKLPKRA